MEVKRMENKIILNQSEALILRKNLDMIMPKDAYCTDSKGYEVRSLYFDTVGDRCCAEKEEGLRVHEKFRIRVYGCDDSVIKLESKKKNGSSQRKRTLFITREICESLCRCDYSPLLELDNPLALYFYERLMSGMRPKSLIQYNRISYALDFNNTRITIDSDIRATESSFDLFSEHLQTRPILSSNYVIAEVKFNNFLLDYVKKALSCINHSPTSFSKYFTGRMFYRRML